MSETGSASIEEHPLAVPLLGLGSHSFDPRGIDMPARTAADAGDSLLLRIILSDEDGPSSRGEDPFQRTPPPTAAGPGDDDLRHLPLTAALESLPTHRVLYEVGALDEFRRTCDNLYQRVRALFFLYAIHRFHFPERRAAISPGGADGQGNSAHECDAEEGERERYVFCPKGYAALLDRRFDESIDYFLASVPTSSSGTLSIDSHTEERRGEGSGDERTGLYASPQRTSLISRMDYCRSDSAATTTSADNSSYRRYSSPRGDGGDVHFSRQSPPSGACGSTAGSPPGKRFGPRYDPDETFLLPSDATSSALARGYRSLAFQTLADQVQDSVRGHPGNEWMFQTTSVGDHPLRFADELLGPSGGGGELPTLLEKTPVRMDISHSCWSDIFFLGMDFPEAARVINCSVDLAVVSLQDGVEHPAPTPPIECRLRLTTENPGTIRLKSVDLESEVLLTKVSQVFDYGADYLGLLKGGLVASGIVPSGLERCGDDVPMCDLIAAMLVCSPEECRYGLELVTTVKNIPKGSRLAVSTNLLGSIIAVCMRATGQTGNMTGTLTEEERRLVAARAILGEWLGGSGGGWQDSGGVWPGLKLIHGVKSRPGDPEFGVSRGRLLPRHHLFSRDEAPPSLLEGLERCLVLVHGGMAQNVGPVLEMVTEKYLLREEEEWIARHRSMEIFDDILSALRHGDIKAIGSLATENFFGPIRSVIPWASNVYTETLIARVQAKYGSKFWGFWMLGGCSGGGMGFIFDPDSKKDALHGLGSIMLNTKREMECSLPFAMDPVVFDYSVNENGTIAELDCSGNRTPTGKCRRPEQTRDLEVLLDDLEFDASEQEQIRSDLLRGSIGLSRNRLPPSTILTDVTAEDVILVNRNTTADSTRNVGIDALSAGEVGIVTLAAGVGSRWTNGAGVVKALNPFCCLGNDYRSFLDVHLAKNRRISKQTGSFPLPHAVTTSWVTDGPIRSYAETNDDIPLYISKGRSIGVRMIPMLRDLKFAWQEQSKQKLDEQAEKVRDSIKSALMSWAESSGEGADYTDNIPSQCLCPVGHWYEVPNLLLNGTLARMLRDRPQLKVLMLHNIDTIGADVDPSLLGKFLETGSTLAYEVVPRCIDDMGGGLCRVNGKPRLVEGFALPSEDDELKLSYYNSLTTWINVDGLLSLFGLDRQDILAKSEKIPDAIHAFSRRVPTYVTIKEVKKRWGHGQEDIHPVAQYEKLWGDMTSVENVDCSYFVVPRSRGQQLKDPAQLDEWSRDSSAAALDSICEWSK